MKKKIEIIFWVFTSVFLLGFFLFFGLSLFYEDNNMSNSLDFGDYEITEKIIASDKKDIIQEMEMFTKKYVDSVYLQWVRINTYVTHGNISDETIECTYDTYDKKSKQYGKIFVFANTVTREIEYITATYGYEKEEIHLNVSTDLTEKLENSTFYLDTASKKMSEANQDTFNYEYKLIFENNQI